MEFRADEKLVLQCALKIEEMANGCGAEDGLTVRSVEFQDAIPAKFNNTSKVLQLQLEYEMRGGLRKRASVVVKVPFLKEEAQYELGRRARFYDKEAALYESVMPRLNRLLRSRVAPALYATDDRRVLFLQDLSAEGYRTRVDGPLDAAHCETALRCVARYHAASHALHGRESGGAIDALVRQQFFIDESFMRATLEDVQPFLDAAAEHRSLSSELVGRFRAAAGHALAAVGDSIRADRFEFNVLSHGDLKAPNILYKYAANGGQPLDCKLIDFQLCHWTSPALDIIFFMVMSADRRVYAEKFDHLLDSYLAELNSTLRAVDCGSVLTKTHVERDLNDIKSFKLFTLLFRILIDVREFCNHTDYAKREKASPEMIEKFVQTLEFQSKMKFWFEDFVKNRVF